MMESNILSLKSIIDLPQTLISKIDIDEQYNGIRYSLLVSSLFNQTYNTLMWYYCRF